jgi:hypothetical protein
MEIPGQISAEIYNVKRTVEWIGPGVSNQRNQSFWALAEIHRRSPQ